MTRYAALFERLGATPGPPAEPAALARVQELFGVRLPDEFRELYLAADGLAVPDLHFEVIPLSQVETYAGVLKECFGYVPFTEHNDSNPYAVCCREPLTGFVVHLHHDDETVLACRSLGRFLDLLAERRRQVPAAGAGEDEEEAAGDLLPRYSPLGDLAFDRPERTAEDARVAGELVRFAGRLGFWAYERTEALRFAAQLLGPGHEAELGRLMALGDEYTRYTVLERCRGLRTPAAEALLRQDAEGLDRFAAELADAVEAAGLEVRRTPWAPPGWTVEPGTVRPGSFDRLYGNRHAPNFLPELVERIRRQQWVSATADPLEKLVRSGLARWWVECRRGEWDHLAWLSFLGTATAQCGPLPADRVGLLLEEEKRRYWDRRRAADRPGGPS